MGQGLPCTRQQGTAGLPQKAAATVVGLGGRVGPEAAFRAAKKVEGSWPPAEMQPVPMHPRPR